MASKDRTRNRTDKVGVFDPAAAPMETDAEASQGAGFGQRAAAAHRRASPSPFAAHLQPGQSRLPRGWAAATLLVLIGLGVLAGAISSTGPGPQQAQESNQ